MALSFIQLKDLRNPSSFLGRILIFLLQVPWLSHRTLSIPFHLQKFNLRHLIHKLNGLSLKQEGLFQKQLEKHQYSHNIRYVSGKRIHIFFWILSFFFLSFPLFSKTTLLRSSTDKKKCSNGRKKEKDQKKI